ncbi:hypothetical protein [Lacipirellula sp.]|uniref:hypothetical protein n=1 Tax=Lacipirellula sp. TaxID=2691419 RepID=UPI003D0C073E
MSNEQPLRSNGGYPTTYDLLPIIQTSLRLLGVYIFIGGMTGVISDLAQVVATWQLAASEYDSRMLFDVPFPTTFYGDLFYALAGLYLMIGGRWLIENVFLPSKRLDDDGVLELTEAEEIPRS